MKKIGLLRNPRSTRNLKHQPLAIPEGLVVQQAGEVAELDGILRGFRASDVSCLAIDGGDGTLREVLSRLPEIYDGNPPPIAILPRGNTNLIAREVGGWAGQEGLEHLVRAVTEGHLRPKSHPILKLEWNGGTIKRGLIMGFGAYASATQIAQAEIAARGQEQVAKAIFSTLRRALLGGEATHLRDGVVAQTSCDGSAPLLHARFIHVITAAQHSLPLGLHPFWVEENGGTTKEVNHDAGALRWLDIEAPARRLAAAAPFVMSGRPRRWMLRQGYHSGRAHQVRIELKGPFVMDGELFESPDDPIFASEEFVTFLSPL